MILCLKIEPNRSHCFSSWATVTVARLGSCQLNDVKPMAEHALYGNGTCSNLKEKKAHILTLLFENNWTSLSCSTKPFLLPFFNTLPVGFWVSGLTPREITLNFPATSANVTYQIFNVTHSGRLQHVGNYNSSTQRRISVKPGLSYRFQVHAYDDVRKKTSPLSSVASVVVPAGKFYF